MGGLLAPRGSVARLFPNHFCLRSCARAHATQPHFPLTSASPPTTALACVFQPAGAENRKVQMCESNAMRAFVPNDCSNHCANLQHAIYHDTCKHQHKHIALALLIFLTHEKQTDARAKMRTSAITHGLIERQLRRSTSFMSCALCVRSCCFAMCFLISQTCNSRLRCAFQFFTHVARLHDYCLRFIVRQTCSHVEQLGAKRTRSRKLCAETQCTGCLRSAECNGLFGF